MLPLFLIDPLLVLLPLLNSIVLRMLYLLLGLILRVAYHAFSSNLFHHCVYCRSSSYAASATINRYCSYLIIPSELVSVLVLLTQLCSGEVISPFRLFIVLLLMVLSVVTFLCLSIFLASSEFDVVGLLLIVSICCCFWPCSYDSASSCSCSSSCHYREYSIYCCSSSRCLRLLPLLMLLCCNLFSYSKKNFSCSSLYSHSYSSHFRGCCRSSSGSFSWP